MSRGCRRRSGSKPDEGGGNASIQASKDGFRRFYQNDPDLKSVVTVVKVQGGNHAGVAHYGPQTFPVHDGKRDISLETQQDLTAAAIAKFLQLA